MPLVYVGFKARRISRNDLGLFDIQAPGGVSERMKKFLWAAGAICGAVAGIMIWSRDRNEPVEELAHRLEAAWSDHNTTV